MNAFESDGTGAKNIYVKSIFMLCRNRGEREKTGRCQTLNTNPIDI